MAEFDHLPADQRAAVQLLLKQGRSYDELAELLAIDPEAVRRRAHDALATLGPLDGPDLDPQREAEISDYLLGQQTVAERERTRELLARSPVARGWAHTVADELRAVAPDAMPEIPSERPQPVGAPDDDRDYEPSPYAVAPDDDRDEPSPYAVPPRDGSGGSRLGGALLLGGAAIALAVVVILLVTSGGSDDNDIKGSTISTTPPTTQTQTSTQAASTQPVAQINLLPPGGGKRPVGVGLVFARGQQRLIQVRGQGLSPRVYALWLFNSAGDSKLLGYVPPQSFRNGQFATQGPLPADAMRFRQLIVTRENVSPTNPPTPTRPGQIVLAGALKLG